MRIRRFRRAVTLGWALILCIVRMWLQRLRGPLSLERKAAWSQWSSRLVLNALGVRYQVEGRPPARGLVVCNHLSYIDILVLEAAMPSFFVAKIEIGGWFFFGMAARSNGTIFVDRGSLSSAMSVAEQMTERLKLPIPVPVVLFPEGTSTDGSQVIRFYSRLIDPAISIGAPITTAAIRYVIDGGIEERELCWYGHESFATHLWKVLGAGGFSADLRFGVTRVYTNRRVAADETRAEIEAMRNGAVLVLQ